MRLSLSLHLLFFCCDLQLVVTTDSSPGLRGGIDLSYELIDFNEEARDEEARKVSKLEMQQELEAEYVVVNTDEAIQTDENTFVVNDSMEINHT